MALSAEHYPAIQKRLSRGFTEEEAYSVPIGMPRWMWRIEQEEGRPAREVVEELLREGWSVNRIAASFEVSGDALGYWIRKWRREGRMLDQNAPFSDKGITFNNNRQGKCQTEF